MGLKTFVLSAALLCSLAAAAHDKIHMKDGSVINATSVSVDDNTVRYKRADNATGPEYTVSRQDVKKIEYDNGTTEKMDKMVKNDDPLSPHRRRRESEGPSTNGNNILSLAPIAYLAATDGTHNNPGLGFSYERLLDDYGHVGISVPVTLNFLSNKDYDDNNYNYGGTPYTTPSVTGYTALMFMPGVKFYPSASHKAVRYSMGLAFFGIMGNEPYYSLISSSSNIGKHSYFNYGFMFSNALNITVMSHVYMGIEMNTGLSISDNRYVHRYDDFIPMPLVQFALRMGYRF